MASIVIGAAGVTLPVNTNAPFNGTSVSGTGNLYVSRSPGVNPINAEKTVGVTGSFSYPPGISGYNLYFATDPGSTITLSYSTDGSTLNPGTTFARASNIPTLITSVPMTVPINPGNFTIANIPILDISNYGSILCVITSDYSPNAGIVPTNFISLTLEEYNDYQSQILGIGVSYTAQWLLDLTGAQLNVISSLANMTLQVPVRQATMSGVLTVHTQNGLLRPANLVVHIYGSAEVISEARYTNNTNLLAGTINNGGIFYQTTSVIQNFSNYIATKNGPATVSFQKFSSATNAQLELSLYESGVQQFIGSATLAAADGVLVAKPFPVEFPMRPVLAQLFNYATGSVNAAILQ